ncbi:MAG TPA: ABC transporter substrate-binding protein, partial [Methylomirabilota bacterium]|nr:ABC transporter substrate-binding protein [Methylomirabilota bacterium]
MIKFRLSICIIALLCAPAQSQELKKIRVAIPTFSLIAAAILIPTERGYFKQEGLDVETIVIRSAPSVLALAAKEVDFLTLGGGALIGILRGLPLRVVYAPFRRPLYAVYAKPDIRSIAELDGKKVGVSSIGSGPDLLLRDIMRKQMADGGKRVTILAVGGGVERFIALKTGVVDAAILATPFTLNAKQDGFREIFSFINDKNYADIPVATFTREDLLQSNPTVVEKFIRAQVKGLLYMRSNRDKTVSSLARALKLKEDAIAPGVDEFRPALTEDGTISQDEQRKALEYLVNPATLKEPPRLDKIYDFSATRSVYQE